MSLIGRDAIVIGAGVAGLAVARALAMRGASVTVLERAPEISDVGAGIQIAPNGGAVLRGLGLDAEIERQSLRSGAVVLCDRSGGEILRMDLHGRERFALIHRADLISVLDQGAREIGVLVETGSDVRAVHLGAAGASVEMQDGSMRQASLVLGADGVHSRARGAIMGASEPQFTGQVAWRALVQTDGEIPHEARVYLAPGRHVVLYPLRDGTLLNVVAVEERDAWLPEGWAHEGRIDDFQSSFAEFDAPVRQVLAQARACMVWGLFRHPVASRWSAPGVALLGDAAHPSLPFLAQGACMALEDAWVLAECLALHDADATAFAAYQSRRETRVRRIVDAARANARNYHLSGVRRYLAHTALKGVNAVAPQRMLNRFDWLYGHDVTLP